MLSFSEIDCIYGDLEQRTDVIAHAQNVGQISARANFALTTEMEGERKASNGAGSADGSLSAGLLEGEGARESGGDGERDRGREGGGKKPPLLGYDRYRFESAKHTHTLALSRTLSNTHTRVGHTTLSNRDRLTGAVHIIPTQHQLY